MTNEVIATLVTDVSTLYPEWFSGSVAKKTNRKISARLAAEGQSFLTKTLPLLGKRLDQALSGEAPFDSTGFRKKPGCEFPMLFGEFFERVLDKQGWIKPDPDIGCIRLMRQVFYLFYKYELPYDPRDENKVLTEFVKTDSELDLTSIAVNSPEVRFAKRLLKVVLAEWDPLDITPRHGPGSVATGERTWEKMNFRRLYESVDRVFPYAEYFYSSASHVCDRYEFLQNLEVLPNGIAKVCLVPKDSRGPRLISEEPLEIQWIQQGLRISLYSYVERHPLTRAVVHFTDQNPNRNAALQASITGKYATIDLKEASDRVSLSLVRCLFPEHVYRALEATRSAATTLPNGETIVLHKFASMGSALCFPVMALVIYAIVCGRRRRLGYPNVSDDYIFRQKSKYILREICRDFLVYGDDVVVPTAQAADAIEALELVGLKVNRSKSFLTGSFRESCGLDAYKGEEVQPVRIKTVWTSHRDASAYTSWVSYSNSLNRLGFRQTAQLIADRLESVYHAVPSIWHGIVPSRDEKEGFPCLTLCPNSPTPIRWKTSKKFQRRLHYVWVVKPKRVNLVPFDGWSELLRFLSSRGSEHCEACIANPRPEDPLEIGKSRFTAGMYAIPRASMLVRKWR